MRLHLSHWNQLQTDFHTVASRCGDIASFTTCDTLETSFKLSLKVEKRTVTAPSYCPATYKINAELTIIFSFVIVWSKGRIFKANSAFEFQRSLQMDHYWPWNKNLGQNQLLNLGAMLKSPHPMRAVEKLSLPTTCIKSQLETIHLHIVYFYCL